MFESKLVAKNSRKNQSADLMRERLIKYCMQILRKLDALEGKESPHYKSMFSKSQVLELFELLFGRIKNLNFEPVQP